jgi:hypothetical protein
VRIVTGGREILTGPGEVPVVPPGVPHRIAGRHQDAAAGKRAGDLVFGLLAPVGRALNRQGTHVPLARRPGPRRHS